MLREMCYDWELDYFGFNICTVDTALLVKDEFLRHVEQKIKRFEINDSNWDSEIFEYGKACETIVNKYRPMGVAEMLKPVLFSRLSGEKANAIKSQKSLYVNDVVEYFKSGGGQKNNYLTIAEDFVGVFRAQNKVLSDPQKKAIKDFVYLADSKPKDLIMGILANAVIKDEYKLDFDYFENNWRSIDQFLRDHRNKAKSVDDAMSKPVDGSISNGKVSKNSKNTSLSKHSLKLDSLFSDIVKFLREKYGVKFTNTHVFKKNES